MGEVAGVVPGGDSIQHRTSRLSSGLCLTANRLITTAFGKRNLLSLKTRSTASSPANAGPKAIGGRQVKTAATAPTVKMAAPVAMAKTGKMPT